MSAPDPIISVERLSVVYRTDEGDVPAVQDVSLRLAPGESLGIVGESGSGKSTVGLSLMQLLPASARVDGEVRVDGRDMASIDPAGANRVRGATIGLVYQDALAAFNPFRRIGPQIAEVMVRHLGYGRRRAAAEAIDALARVGISDAADRYRQYPHQFSGGMRQRAAIAMALVAKPKVLLADEPTTALDVTVQTQILRLLRDIRLAERMAMVVISHDLQVIRETTDRIAVMYHGRIVETGSTADVLANPQHPYTRDLIRSAPTVESPVISFIPGTPPSPTTVFEGCSFEPRCSVGRGDAACLYRRPTLGLVACKGGIEAACHYPLCDETQPAAKSETSKFQREGKAA